MNVSILATRAFSNNSRINTSTLQNRVTIRINYQIRHPHTTITTRQRTQRQLSTTSRRRVFRAKAGFRYTRIRHFRTQDTRPISLRTHSTSIPVNGLHNNLNSIQALVTGQHSTARRRIVSLTNIRKHTLLRHHRRPNRRIRQFSTIRHTVDLTFTAKHT